jgi:EAL domain-containing protein (putative c-di-GMP-specific phosphodiesterase class I)
MVHHGQDAVIVEAIFVMAERLGLSVIAEGVENMDQYRRLCELGCDEIQGFLFSTPLAEDQLAAFLSAHHHFTR